MDSGGAWPTAKPCSHLACMVYLCSVCIGVLDITHQVILAQLDIQY